MNFNIGAERTALKKLVLTLNEDQPPSGRFLTQAQRKVYPPEIFTAEEKDRFEKEDRKNLNDKRDKVQTKSDNGTDSKIISLIRCSVIQRAPQTSKSANDEESGNAPKISELVPEPEPEPEPEADPEREPEPEAVPEPEPEQDQPIDYHIPKRHFGEDENTDEVNEFEDSEVIDEHKKLATAKQLTKKTIYYINRDKNTTIIIPGIMKTAMGHTRSDNTGGGSSGGNGGNNSSSGGSSGGNQQSSGNYSSGGGGGGSGGLSSSGGGGGGGGTLGGGGGGGSAGGGGKDNRQNYGPSSPPTGSLPPFYESLKNSTSNGSMNGGFSSAYSTYNMLMPVMTLSNDENDDRLNQQTQQMEDMYISNNNTNNNSNNNGSNNCNNSQQNRQYSLLQNANCNFNLDLELKEEIDTFQEEEDVAAKDYENAVNLLTSG